MNHDSDQIKEEYLDEIKEKSTKTTGFGMKEADFVQTIPFHQCLYRNSQTPPMKIKKPNAMHAVGKKIKKTDQIKEEYLDEIKEKSTKTKGFGMKEADFVQTIQYYPCLFDKSQTPPMKIKKLNALHAVGEKIKKTHAIDLSNSQIRKKIENMKLRMKMKMDNKKTDDFVQLLKSHEKLLLNLMNYNNSPVLNKITGAVGFGVPGTSKDAVEPEDVVLEEEERNNQYLIFELQKEVLTEQKELNQQQRELNIHQNEIFALQNQKLLLEIELLKRKLNRH